MKTGYRFALLLLLTIGLRVVAQEPATAAAQPGAVLVELFTSEGCSDCPPADALLKEMHLHTTAAGQLIIGISEHVTYWNQLGWTDPFSAEAYSARQSAYSTHFGLDSVYTPQMVVNGRTQFVGSDRRALQGALLAESQRKQIALHIVSAQIAGSQVAFTYSANGLPAKGSYDLMAVLVDDLDRSSVRRGENSGRDLVHVSVARTITNLGKLQPAEAKSATLLLPASLKVGGGNHLVLFAQETGTGAVIGVDAKQL